MSESQPAILRSLANPTVKRLVRMRNNRARRKANRVIVDGWRETRLAIEGGLNLVGLYRAIAATQNPATQNHVDGSVAPDGHSVEPVTELDLLAPSDREMVAKKTTWVSQNVLEKIGYGESARGVVAEFERPRKQLESVDLPNDPLIMVLDQIEKPGNVGAIFRSVEAAGVDAILLCDSGDPYHPNAVRSSCGAVFHVRWAETDESSLTDFLAANGFRVLAARVEGAVSCWSTAYQGAVAIIVGNEARGLGDRWTEVAGEPVQGVHIPMAGRIDSLNVSVSAALLAFCAVNRRAAPG